jgi:hypothetical protein
MSVARLGLALTIRRFSRKAAPSSTSRYRPGLALSHAFQQVILDQARDRHLACARARKRRHDDPVRKIERAELVGPKQQFHRSLLRRSLLRRNSLGDRCREHGNGDYPARPIGGSPAPPSMSR